MRTTEQIEWAIRYIEPYIKTASCNDGKEALETAVEVLRLTITVGIHTGEMCDYCKKLFTGGYISCILDPNSTHCSRCGRKLD